MVCNPYLFYSVWFYPDAYTLMKQKNPEMELGFILVMGVLAEIFQPIYYVFNRHLILISCHCISYITYLWTTWMFQIFSLSLFPLTCFLITELYPLQGCSCSKVASRSNFPLLVSLQVISVTSSGLISVGCSTSGVLLP